MRFDGSLAERTTYSPPLTHPEVNGTEFALFAQDRWRVSDRLIFEAGHPVRSRRHRRADQLFTARGDVHQSSARNRLSIKRGGFGKFSERTPLTVGAFTQYDVQTVSRFASDGTSLGAPVTFVHVTEMR